MEEEVVMSENGSLEFHQSVEINGVVKENENPDVDFLEDLDSYWEDINDRLTISRVVSDSILKGMVTAIESEAAEEIANKDLELSRIKGTLNLYYVGSEEKVCLDPQVSLGSSKTEAKKQLLMLVQELTDLRSYIKTNGTGANMDDTFGAGTKTVDKMLDSLKSTLETVLKRKNVGELPLLWQEENEFKKEIESAVVTSFVRSLKGEYQQRLLAQEAEFGGKNSLVLGNVKEITCLRQELEEIRKSLSDHENGDIEAGEGDRKRVEQLHRKMSGGLNLASSIKDTNGKHEENNEALRHLSPDELISHFKTEMNKMKRDHDYEIQEKTEQYFTLKRKYLNLAERGSFSFVGKDKEVEVLKKKIPFVISKLDKILLEDEKLMSQGKDNAYVKSRLDSLFQENRQLKESLSEAAEKMSHHSRAEADYQNLIQKLESDVDDSLVKASIFEDVYGCFMKEFVSQIKCAKQQTDLEHTMMREAYELILKDLESKDARESKDDFEDSCVMFSIAEECSAVIYKEAFKEADKKIVELNMNVTEKEAALRSEMLEKERLKDEIHSRECLLKKKEDLVQKAESNFDSERKKFELVSQQINNLQSQIDELKTKIHRKDEELRAVSKREVEQKEGYETKISNLREELELARECMQKAKDEKKKTEQMLLATKAEEETVKKHLLSLDLVSPKLVNGFRILEDLVAEKTLKTNLRLKNMHSQLSDLSHQINELKSKESMHKRRLKEKCCDLQKAETEVDLLGDEVESLLDLLEKIYIALDHYSPILKHYPSITEILKLVRRELCGESKRLSDG